MSKEAPVVFVVDDDESVREAIRNLLESVRLPTRLFGSTEEFVKAQRPAAPSCLVLDVRLPGRNGLEFQEELKKTGVEIPIIFITAHGDIPMTSRAMKAGAVEFLPKPFQKCDLLAAIHQALERDKARLDGESKLAGLRSRFDSLTAREREVLHHVIEGLMNKEIAAELGLSEITVKVHRGHMMDKMRANSVAELVRMSEKLKLRDRN